MSIQDQIRQKFNEARKNKDELNRKAYESVIAKIMVAEKSGKYTLPLNDDVVVSLIQKEVKELEETRSCYLQVPPFTPLEDKVIDGVVRLDTQIKELQQYLPKALTLDEVRHIIMDIIDGGETNKGKIIKEVVGKVGNRFERSKIPGLVEVGLMGQL